MILYLDNAATSYPKPKSVLEAVRKCIDTCGNPGRSAHEMAMESANQVFACRCELCDYFGYDHPENVIFTLNATYAINLAITALYEEDTHVLLSDLEHNATLRPIHRLASERKISYSVFSHKGNVMENIKKATTAKTKMLICLHASNVTGEYLPIYEIGNYCRAKGIRFVIDASQSAGHFPFVLKNLHFDALCAPGHKGLLGIQGCGFVIMQSKEQQRDFIMGGTGSQSFLPHMPLALPDRYEAGTLPVPAICALRHGIQYVKEHTEDLLRTEKLTANLHEEIDSLKECHLVSKPTASGIVSFTCNQQEEYAKYCSQNHVCLRSGFHCAPLAHKSIGTEKEGCIRVSLGIFTTEREIEKFVSLTHAFFRSS